ncbi:hypothetical protein DFH09DRAFT_1368543 [Mycena vulgaris]|nr:hypothetical protein DFH09DRAFT_1368543 [Mycena vulgaris]
MISPPTAYLPLLPVELWHACWDHCSPQQIRRLSLVCHLFRSLALPLLLQHQFLDMAAGRDTWMDRVRHLRRTAVRLDRLGGSPYAPLVRSWKATFLSATQRQDIDVHIYDRVIASFRTTLGRYQNLFSLHIHHLTVDAPFRRILLSLSALEDLALCDCNIVAQIGFLQLRSLRISGVGTLHGGQGPLQVADPNSLRSLDLTSDISSLIIGFGPGTLPHLVHLSVGVVNDVGALFTFLNQCPRLESLAITSLNGRSSLAALRRNTIPLLRTLAGPPQLIELLAPNRPVSAVTVSGEHSAAHEPEDLLHMCTHLSRSTRPLHSFVLPCSYPTLKLLLEISCLFPELKELAIHVAGPTQFRYGGSVGEMQRINRTMPSVHPGSLELLSFLDLFDEDAFDDSPEEEISDAESDEPPIIIVATDSVEANSQSSGIDKILRWLSSGLLWLPLTVERLRLEASGNIRSLSVAHQHQAIAALSRRCARFYEVQLLSNKWRRTGEVWKAQGQGECIRVVSTGK